MIDLEADSLSIVCVVVAVQFGMLAHNLQAHGETTIREVFDWLLGDQKRCAASEVPVRRRFVGWLLVCRFVYAPARTACSDEGAL